MMDPRLQNNFFKEFEQQVYYNRYFKELKTREDGRKFQETRKLNLVLNSLTNFEGSCILKKGKMVIVCEVKATFQQQFINVLTNKPQTPLLNIHVSLPENRQLTSFQKKKKQSFISYSIQNQLKKFNLQEQLLTKNKHKLFGYKLDIQIRILSEDGGMLQHSLIAVEFALQTTKLKTSAIQGEQVKLNEIIRVLDFNHFIIPTTLSCVNGQPIVDPTSQEQSVQSYSLVNWIDIMSNDYSTTKSGDQELQREIILKYEEQVQQQRKNILTTLNIKEIISKIIQNPEDVLNIQLKI